MLYHQHPPGLARPSTNSRRKLWLAHLWATGKHFTDRDSPDLSRSVLRGLLRACRATRGLKRHPLLHRKRSSMRGQTQRPSCRPGSFRSAPRHPVHPLAREVPHGLPGMCPRHLPRRALPRHRGDPHPRRRLRHHHRLPGQLRHFVAEKAAVYERKAAEIGRAEAIVAEKRAWVERFGAKATKAKQAQSRLKQIEKIEVGELDQTSRRAPHFSFDPERPSGKEVLLVEHLSKAYGDKRVLRDVSLTIRRGERVAVVGQNGLGKSTLLKIVTEGLEADAGRVQWGHETRVGYFPQDHHEILTDENAKPIDVVWDLVPSEPTTYVRGQLGRMLFSGQDVEKKVGLLSGGEAARLVFCRIAVQKPNVLVLDEPTNHLDLESIHALTKALKSFEGAVLFVSHDRAFVSALATRVLEVTESGFHDLPGTYDEFLAQRGADHLDADAVVLRAKKDKARGSDDAPKSTRPPALDGRNGAAAGTKTAPATNGAAKNGAPATAGPPLSWEEQKKAKNRKKQLPALRDAAWKAVETAEARKEAIHARWCEAGFYERTPPAEIAALEAEEKALSPRIESLMAEWDALEKELQ